MVSRIALVTLELVMVFMSGRVISSGEFVMAVSGMVTWVVMVTASKIPSSGMEVTSFSVLVVLDVMVSVSVKVLAVVVSGVTSLMRGRTVSSISPPLITKTFSGDALVVTISVVAMTVKSLAGVIVFVAPSDDVMTSVRDVVMVMPSSDVRSWSLGCVLMAMFSVNSLILAMFNGDEVVLSFGDAIVIVEVSSPGDADVVVMLGPDIRDIMVLMFVGSFGDVYMSTSGDVGMVMTSTGLLAMVLKSSGVSVIVVVVVIFFLGCGVILTFLGGMLVLMVVSCLCSVVVVVVVEVVVVGPLGDVVVTSATGVVRGGMCRVGIAA